MIGSPIRNDPRRLTMRGRVRLCSYYFVEANKVGLRGALATIVPADKKLLHGMRDAILAPTEQSPMWCMWIGLRDRQTHVVVFSATTFLMIRVERIPLLFVRAIRDFMTFSCVMIARQLDPGD